jgi:hypothetical protein
LLTKIRFKLLVLRFLAPDTRNGLGASFIG